MVNHLKLVKIRIKAKAIESINLPDYSGSVFRGSFGHAFKETACITLTKNCPPCEQKKLCAYYNVFETDYPHDTLKTIKRFEKPPKPYIIEPPPMNLRSFEAGKTFYFNLILIGTAIEYLPYFIFTIKQMGKDGIGRDRGQFIIEDVQVFSWEQQDYASIFVKDKQNIINLDSDKILTFNSLLNNSQAKGLREVKLRFVTPTHITVNKSPSSELEFANVFSRLMSRLSLLSMLYCDDGSVQEFKTLIDQASTIKVKENSTSWYSFNKFSNKQKQSYSAGGYIGDVIYQGNFQELYPYLKLGEEIHIGKNTTLGFGKYEVVG